mgnify:FL=1|jgi:hypothetical protein
MNNIQQLPNALRSLRWAIPRYIFRGQNSVYTRTWDSSILEKRFTEAEGMGLPESAELLEGSTAAYEEFFHSLNVQGGGERLKKMCSAELYDRIEPDVVGRSETWLEGQAAAEKCLFHSIDTSLLGVALPEAALSDIPDGLELTEEMEKELAKLMAEARDEIAKDEDAQKELDEAEAEPFAARQFDVAVKVGFISEFSTTNDEDDDDFGARYYRSDVLEFGASWSKEDGLGEFVVFNIA